MEEIIKKQLENIDIKEIVEEYIENSIGREVRNKLESSLKKLDMKIDKIFQDEINKTMSSEIIIKDGWTGVHKKYDSFEQLFKEKFSEKVKADSGYKTALGIAVKERVEKLMAQIDKDVIEKLVDSITKSYIKK